MKRALLRNIFQDEHRTNEKKFKFIEERVSIVEKHVPDLKNKISDYASKRNGARKSLTKVSGVLHNLATADSICLSFRSSLERLSEMLVNASAQEEILAAALRTSTTQDLDELGKQCKHIRCDLKAAISAANKETTAKRQLQRLDMLRDQNGERLSAAEADVLKTKGESAKAANALEEHALIFEQRKVAQVQTSLLEWMALELQYHARGLELFTEAYNIVQAIDPDFDLQEFRKKLLTSEVNARLNSSRDSNNSTPVGKWSSA